MQTTIDHVTRRRFLLGSAGAAATALLAACGGSTSATNTPQTAATRAAATVATSGAAGTASIATPSSASTAITGSAPAASNVPAVQTSANVTVLNFWSARDTTGFNAKQVDAINAQAKGFRIQYQEIGAITADLHDKFAIAGAAKDRSVDMLFVDAAYVAEYAAAGWTSALDDLFGKDEQAQFFPGAIAGDVYQGKLSALPWWTNGAALFYRKDLFDAAGLQPPKTLADEAAAAKKLQAGDVAGIAEQTAQTEGGIIVWMELLWAMGGDLVDDKLNVVVDKGTAGRDSLQYLVDLLYKDKVLPEASLQWKLAADPANVFQNGGAAMMRNWYGNVGTLNDPTSKVKGKWDVVSLPSKDGTKAGPNCLGTWNLGIVSWTKNRAAAAEAIRAIVSPAQEKARLLANGQFPVQPAVLDDAEVRAKFPYSVAAKQSFGEMKPRPVTPYYSQMSADAMQPNFGLAVARMKSPEQAIADMAAKMREIAKQ